MSKSFFNVKTLSSMDELNDFVDLLFYPEEHIAVGIVGNKAYDQKTLKDLDNTSLYEYFLNLKETNQKLLFNPIPSGYDPEEHNLYAFRYFSQHNHIQVMAYCLVCLSKDNNIDIDSLYNKTLEYKCFI